MKDIIQEVISNLKKLKVTYGDVRYEIKEVEEIKVRNGIVEKMSNNRSEGIGIRVLNNGAWGFASSSSKEMDLPEKLSKKAYNIAKASALTKKKDVMLVPESSYIATYRTKVKEDPFKVPLSDKVDILMKSSDEMMKVKYIKVAEANINIIRTIKYFANTDGSIIEQEIIMTGGGLCATAVKNGDIQKHSYPSAFGGDFGTCGFEKIRNLNLIENAYKTAEIAKDLLFADEIPYEPRTIIIGGSQLALQVHESCGHPVELDRALGEEISLAGDSFLTTDKLNNFKYGSNLVNIVADATEDTSPGGCGTFGFDDEGVPAQRVYLIKDGIFSGYLSSRETAYNIGLKKSCGAMRSDSWSHIPIIRMTNINLLPGNGTLDELIADTKDGIFIDLNKSWSIDDKRINFQFGVEIGWEIKKGKLGKLLKNIVYSGITPEFWGSMDAVCGKDEWHIWGVPNCGKGDPMQTMQVGHGTAPARFHNVLCGSRSGK